MNETMKKNLKRSLAAFLAVVLVIGLGFFTRGSWLKADENQPEAEVVTEAADVPVMQEPEPEPEPEPAAEPEPEPAQEIVVQEVTVDAPAEEAPAAEAEGEAAAEEADAGEQAEETLTKEAPEEPAFNVEKAYDEYMELTEDWEKEQYLNKLSKEDCDALKKYIEEKEAEAAPAAELEAEPEEDAEAEAEAMAETDEAEAETAAGSEPEAEAAPEAVAETKAAAPTFGSAHIGGEWAGRDTSSVRNLTVNVYIDGALAESCTSSANKSVADFEIYAGDCEIADVTTAYWAMTGSGSSWSVDMYGANDVTVDVNMTSPVIIEEPAAPEAEETPEEEAPAEAAEEPAEAELTEEAEETEPELTEEEITITEEEQTVEAELTEEEITVTGEENTTEIMITDETSTVEAESAEEEEIRFTFVRDEEGNLVLDENGDPVIEVEGDKAIIVEYERDEEGNLVLDENGDPIVLSVKEAPEEYNGRVEIHLEVISKTYDYGSKVKWVSEILDDAEGLELTYQWYETADGENWEPIEGANEPEYVFTVTEENLSHQWKVRVL